MEVKASPGPSQSGFRAQNAFLPASPQSEQQLLQHSLPSASVQYGPVQAQQDQDAARNAAAIPSPAPASPSATADVAPAAAAPPPPPAPAGAAAGAAAAPPQPPPPPAAHEQHQQQHQPQPAQQQAAASPPAEAAPAAATPARDTTRTRHSSACFPCAKRKVKCDRDVKNPCSNCLRRAQPELCQVKSQKEKLAHSRSDATLRDGEGHRDKRPRYEAYQSSFHATPAPKSELSPHHHPSGEPSLIPSMANYVANPPDDRAPSFPKRSPPPSSAKKSREPSHWDAIEALLPPRKDLLKYINTFRVGPHLVNPVISNLDAFESQVCIFLEEIGTPKIKQRLAGKDRRASEIELGRLARLLAVLASGSRYEDSDYATQVAISRDYVRRAFQCLRLANYMTRPTIECIQTLLLLTTELQNDHQPDAAWAVLGMTARLAHSVGINFKDYLSLPADHDFSISRSSIAWQDMMHSLWHHDPSASLALALPVRSSFSDNTTYVVAMCEAYRAASACLTIDMNPATITAGASADLQSHLGFLRSACRSHAWRECKSMRDRHEVAGLKLHSFYLLSSVLLSMGEAKGKQYPAEALEHDEQARTALLEIIQTFVDFSTISSLPLRTYIMVHYAVTSALELCRWPQAPDGTFQGNLLPRLLASLDGLASHVATNGASSPGPRVERLLSAQQLRAFDLLGHISNDSRQVYADRNQEREIPEALRAEAGLLLQEMDQSREGSEDADGTSMPVQALWGL